MKAELTQERLKELLLYDPNTGCFVWLKKTSNRVFAGQIAGAKDAYGYTLIGVDGSRYFAHRLAWFYVHGYFPPQYIDHVNGDRCDNRIGNLRLCTPAENQQNKKPKRGRSLPMGVMEKDGRFRAEITILGKKRNLGRFNTAEEAHLAYLRAKGCLHTFNPIQRA